ncbi:MAG: adenylate/guanylate cyclase domain-containing protein [Tagaea sp.]
MKAREIAVAAAIVAGVSVFPATPWGERVAGLSLDSGFALRHAIFGPARGPEDTNVVVIAVDEETHRTPPFGGLPQALWTREIAPVLNAVLDADAKIVAFDLIFPTSVERLIPGFERDFLRSLRAGARDGRVLLGKVQHQTEPIAPFQGQSFAVGHAENIRSVNFVSDRDDAIRRVPLFFEAEAAGGATRRETAFALEIASRMVGLRPEEKDGTVLFAGKPVPGGRANAMPIDFTGGGREVPAFSLADLRACAEKNDEAFFKRHFAGKAVLVGVVLDVEDRKITSKRFMTGPEGAAAGPRCALEPRADLVKAGFVREAIPGVFIHAAAIENFLRGGGLRELGPVERAAASLPGVALAAAAALSLPAWLAGFALLGIAALWTGLATILLQSALVIPWLDGLAASVAAAALTMGWRFAVADKDKRFLRQSFALYLAPAVIDKMVAGDKPPQLGGEEREITVLFSDVAGFTALSEGLTPCELVTTMNVYLSAMTDIIEAHGGFVDKYIGDAIVAVFGAPVDDPDHARHAVQAALACQAKLAALNADPAQPFRGKKLGARIGLNTGRALVGNMGSARRFNYTVMGDTVNLASRLEGANKYFGSAIMVSDATRRAAGEDGFVWRELDRVKVKGRAAPVGIHEPLPAEKTELAKPYAEALSRHRARDFVGAKAVLDIQAKNDPAAASFLARVEECLADPPGADWEAVTELEGK